jgi:hypothetical protein
MNCSRCGIAIGEKTIERRRARGTLDGRCSDCRLIQLNEINYNGTICRPWRGELDENLYPIDRKLRPYLPGIRTCGHKDCVNKAHIIPELDPLERERNSISYRTGKEGYLKDYLRELSA